MARNRFLPQSTADNAYDLLSEIVNLILDEPLRYNQGSWLFMGEDIEQSRLEPPMCNTIGCVAGWAATLKNKVPEGFTRFSIRKQLELENQAIRLLGLTADQASELFDGSAVQGMFETIHGAGVPAPATQTLEYALMGALHIRLFQAQHADMLKAKAV